MALSFEMNNDIEKYEEDVVAGFGLKKVLYGLVGLIIGVGLAALLYFLLNVPLIVCCYVATPFCAIAVMLGSYRPEGMSIGQYIRYKLSKKNRGPLIYSSTESQDNYGIESVKDNNSTEDEFEQQMRKMKKVFVGLGVVILVIIVVAVIMGAVL